MNVIKITAFCLLAITFSSLNAKEVTKVEATVSVEQVVSDMQTSDYSPEPVKTAEEQAADFVYNSGLSQGWNENQEMFISIGTAEFDSENPSYDDAYVVKRSLKAMQATLEAKARIIEYIETEMSAMDKATTPGTDLSEVFDGQLRKLEKKMNAQKAKLAKMLADMDKKESQALEGATLGDRMNALMDAAIKKLDSEYSKKQIEADKKEAFEKAKNRYQEALAEYQALEEKIKAEVGKVKEDLSSTVETISRMPLFGATTVAQFESWDSKTERYNVALVVVWGKKTERVARAFIQGEDFKVPPGNETIRDWIKNNNWATSVGGRQFRDSDGVFHFVGISAAATGESSSSRKRARGIAEQMAKKEVAMALYADVESKKKADQRMQTMSGGKGKDTQAAMESFSETLSQEIKNRTIKGLQRRYGGYVKHPISQQELYVAIYSLDGNSAKQALWAQERNYLTKILDVKSQQAMKGRTAGMQDAVKKQEQDTSTFNNARAKSSSTLTSKAQAESTKQNVTTVGVESTKIESKSTDESKAARRPRSGSFSGGGQSGGLAW